jgi:serine/threonine protein kinase
MREAALLRRVPPPHAPRLYDFGLWQHPAGPFPFLVMEWIEGAPLYAWAHGQQLSSRQLLRVLAPVARALVAVHSVQAVHRDVKGDNILVRTEDSHPKLLDFGAGDFQGAPTLTREVLPPGTPGYRSPEALRFHWRSWSTLGARYAPGPADDLYALGVTAYRLATGRYPPPLVPAEVLEQEPSTPTLASEPPEKWASVSPELAGLIHQLLSEEPLARGSAAQVAQQMEAAEAAGPRADEPVVQRFHAVPAVRKRLPESSRPARAWRPWLGAAAGLAVMAGLAVALVLHSPRDSEPQAHVWPPEDAAHPEQEEDSADAGVSLAKEVQRVSARVEQPQSTWEGLSAEKAKEPLPGQARPPCKRRGSVEINGGCWWGRPEAKPPCREGEYEWEGRCYHPTPAPAPPATSEQR